MITQTFKRFEKSNLKQKRVQKYITNKVDYHQHKNDYKLIIWKSSRMLTENMTGGKNGTLWHITYYSKSLVYHVKYCFFFVLFLFFFVFFFQKYGEYDSTIVEHLLHPPN